MSNQHFRWIRIELSDMKVRPECDTHTPFGGKVTRHSDPGHGVTSGGRHRFDDELEGPCWHWGSYLNTGNSHRVSSAEGAPVSTHWLHGLVQVIQTCSTSVSLFIK